jgi:hypothetical protein
VNIQTARKRQRKPNDKGKYRDQARANQLFHKDIPTVLYPAPRFVQFVRPALKFPNHPFEWMSTWSSSLFKVIPNACA